MTNPFTTLDLQQGRIVIDKQFDATMNRVWSLWTEAAQIEQWWAPPQAQLRVERCEIRPDGRVDFVDRLTCVRQASWLIRYADKPRRLVFDFEDPRLPLVHTDVVITAHGPQRSHVRLTLTVNSDEARHALDNAGFAIALNTSLNRAADLARSG